MPATAIKIGATGQTGATTRGETIMSEIRINIIDSSRAVSGILHAGIADAVLAGLAAEPETIKELEDAMARFAIPADNEGHLAEFSDGVYVDLAARVFAAESSYSILMPEGEVQFHNGKKLTETWLPYRVPHDWHFLDSVDEYTAVADLRRGQRRAVRPFDARIILYGAIAEYVANECRAAFESNTEDPITGIHAKWLMTPRDDLHGLPPRDILLMKHEHISWDMQWREVQWSLLKEPPPCLSKESFAYCFAGFGTHEIVIYYNLVRMLIADCWKRMSEEKDIYLPNEIVRLEQVKTAWLNSPDSEYGGKTPLCIIENERIRLPWLLSEEDSPFFDDCPCCQAMAAATFQPGFWHLDGCNMDEGFAFSFYRTQAEWEEENRRFEKIGRGLLN
jgi:hypothetical protein